jgi:predicted phosphodiesterase
VGVDRKADEKIDAPEGTDSAVGPPGASPRRRRLPRPPRAVVAAARAVPAAARRAGRRARHRTAAFSHRHPTWWPRLRVAAFAVVGAVLALALFGHVPAKVGPFETTLAARPALSGHTVVHLAPLGTIDLNTHDWPLALDLRVDEIGVNDAERLANDPRAVDRLGDEVAEEVRSALIGLVVRCVIVALLGGVVGALAARLSWRSALGGAGVAALLVLAAGGGVAATFHSGAVAEPRYTGLLTRAPAAVGDVEEVLDRFGEYRAQLADLVDNVATLYLAGENLPTFEPGRTIRVLHVSDIHLNPGAFDLMRRLTDQFGVDAIVDTGDLTDWGTDPETAIVDQIGTLDVPYVYVRGNHDSRGVQEAVAAEPNAIVLDGEAATVAGLRFWGIGDPRYTPDKSQPVGGHSEMEVAEAYAPRVADVLVQDEPPPVDVVLIHDPRAASDLGGMVPLVLAGHEHQVRTSVIEPREPDEDSADDASTATTAGSSTTGDGQAAADETLLLVEGSTGGAGLRGLQGEEPEPLTASVLYFDPTSHRLLAYDRVTVAGLGETGATIERHVIGTGEGGQGGDGDG